MNPKPNETCPCGSWRKSKGCCGPAVAPATPVTEVEAQPKLPGHPGCRLEPGAYKTPRGFLPSIGWKRQDVLGEWDYEAILVREEMHEDEDEAVRITLTGLDSCVGDGADSKEVANGLEARGYKRVEGFKIRPPES